MTAFSAIFGIAAIMILKFFLFTVFPTPTPWTQMQLPILPITCLLTIPCCITYLNTLRSPTRILTEGFNLKSGKRPICAWIYKDSGILACNNLPWSPITFSFFSSCVCRHPCIPHISQHSPGSLETPLYVAQDCVLLVCLGATFVFQPPYFWVRRSDTFILSKVISLLQHSFWKAINCSIVSFKRVPLNLRSVSVFLLLSHALFATAIVPGSLYAFESKYKYVLNSNPLILRGHTIHKAWTLLFSSKNTSWRQKCHFIPGKLTGEKISICAEL